MTKNFQQASPSGMGLGDIAYVLFKHKWKLILISLLGLAGAAAYYFGAPPVYASQAKLMVRYVVERSAVDQVQNTTSLSTGQGGDAVMQSELEILTSRDLAEEVGSLPGMEKLVPKSNTPSSPEEAARVAAAAARIIAEGLKVSAVKGSNVVWVEFEHGDPTLAREVLRNLIKQYFIKHLEIHRSKEAAKFVTEKVEKSRTKLKGAEDDLMKLKADSGIMSLPESIAALNNEGAKVQSDLTAAEAQLAEQKARLAALERFAAGKDGAVPLVPAMVPAKSADGAAASEPAKSAPPLAATGGADPAPPNGSAAAQPGGSATGAFVMASPDNEYSNAVSGLKLLEAERMEMLKVYREEHYAVKELNEKITRQKAFLEIYKERSAEGSDRRFRTVLLTEQAQVAAIEAKVGKLREALAAVQKNVLALTTVMPKISEKETARDVEAGNFKYMSASLEKAQVDEALDPSKMPNISTVQEASPAAMVVSKRNKIALQVVGGTTGAAVALTLLFGLILKRRINRPQDLENRLGVPLLLSIPFFGPKDRLRLLQPKGANGSKALNHEDRLRLLHPKTANGANGEDSKQSLAKVEPPKAPWERGHFIRPFSEAVRDRLGLYFEAKGITHKPKLIGVTGFSRGAGTSTLAAGLAAALSEIGEGKVLMVDMTADDTEGDTHPFFAGRPAVALDDVLKPAGEIKSTAENLYLATADPNSPGSGSLGLSKFRRIMRDIQASDFDYMVFDMPQLSQTSSTAAMAGLMDQVLVIVEAEANSPEEVKRGFRDLVESRAKVSVVFNKARPYGSKLLGGGRLWWPAPFCPVLRNRIYYGLKPYIPYGLRMALRSRVAARLRKTTKAVWPVLPGSERPPAGWTGWPEGKKFALVLTHDVEGPVGLAKCRKLMEVERELGFRSSFNFIPEGSYRVPSELREDLSRHGFEVGIHDLKHDGFLFQSSRGFTRCAPEINRYIKEWGASGFRSGFMLTDLNWLHQLDIRYDASTFDTDPFEPKPVGHNVIFPFWVSRPQDPSLESRPPGYVELPYTLAQDSTLFLILKEQTTDVWKSKLDWVAEHGGMALLNTHPDYMAMSDEVRAGREYPVARYAEFLSHVREKFEGSYWHANPCEVAEWFRKVHAPAAVPVAARRPFAGRKAAVVLFSYYPADPRPRREAEALHGAGMEVDLICLQDTGQLSRETINGVNVRRVPLRRKREGKLTYLIQYSQFIVWSGFALLFRSFSKKYNLVHVHNMPDILAFSALAPKLRGAKLILDLHDPMPELMMSIFGLKEDHFLVRSLKFLEKASIWFADRVLTVNSHCKQIFSRRSCEPGKVQVVMNTPDERIFHHQEVSVAADRDPARPYVLMFHGSLVARHGVDLAVQAVAQVRKTIPNIELRIYGHSTPFLESILESCRRDGLEGAVRYLGAKTLEEIVRAIGECDLGLIPNRRSIFTEINTPTRIFEYLACGKPVLAPRAPGITDYFGPQDLLFFELGDGADLAREIARAYAHPEIVREVVARGQQVYREHTWAREKLGFLSMVGDLLGVDAPPVPQQSAPAIAASNP